MTQRRGTMTSTKDLAKGIAADLSEDIANKIQNLGDHMTPERAPSSGGSLVAKLAEVMAAVSRVPKRGRNDFHKYDYATEADIAEAVRLELAKRGIMIIPSCDGVERDGDLTVTRHTYRITDGDETLACSWAGFGQDKGDKGLYKAFTGAEKYFLLKLFLMPTGDDPERDDSAKSIDTPTTKADLVKATPLPDDGKVRITDVDVRTGPKKTGGTWTKWHVTFSDGKRATTFSETLASKCEGYRDRQLVVVPQFEAASNPKWDDTLVECDPEAPTMYVVERVAGKKDYDGNEGPPYRLWIKDHPDEIYLTEDAAVADEASEAVERSTPVAFQTVAKMVADKEVLMIEDFRTLPF